MKPMSAATPARSLCGKSLRRASDSSGTLHRMTTPIAPCSWSTNDVPAPQRLDYWVGAITEGFLAMDASGSRKDFHGELRSAPLGRIGVNWVQASAQEVWRTRRGIARGRSEQFFYLLGNMDTPWTVAQDGREALMRPGEFVLVDSRRPYRFGFGHGPTTVSLELPLAWVTHWVAEPEAHTARPFGHDAPGWAAALAAFAREWRPEMASAPPLPASLLEDQLGALLSLACGPQALRQALASTALADRVRAVLRQRLAEPGLTATDVATCLGCSVRSIHRAMSGAGTTFAQALMTERMTIAKQMLDNAALRRVSAGEIGRRVGLLDPSHFSRSCRRLLGHTPSALRGH